MYMGASLANEMASESLSEVLLERCGSTARHTGLSDYINKSLLGLSLRCPQTLTNKNMPDRFWGSCAPSPATQYLNIPPSLSKVRCWGSTWYVPRHSDYLRAWH
jgi:hypothetical protein